ncbi:transaldolase [Frankia sp. Cppng1_Ct_nod]|uniref:transaldolase n=1 Tax=Frankia sp. Cppng1_Ct_nod TaxID=2897162 RepID=UPI0020249DF3|nr:transaldolase [Frankia sp. Cppng1_Ct_nod]
MSDLSDPLRALAEAGVAVWLDDLSRDRLRSQTPGYRASSLAALVRDRHVVGVTTNPTIFHSAISDGHAYDGQLRDLAWLEVRPTEALRLITSHDVRAACDLLRPIHDMTEGRDGFVSIEVDPRLANDTERTVAEAQLLWWLVDRPNVLIKIPATERGVPAIRRTLAEGISVNATLIFSLDRYDAVMNAFLSGLEQARQAGRTLSRIASVASFFISRVDTEVDRQLDKIGTAEAVALRGRAAIANARLAYQRHLRVFGSERWRALEVEGARSQRPLWASTGVKDPAYDDTRYVLDLVTPGVVNTMPEATLNAVADHGVVRGDTMSEYHAEAEHVLAALTHVGVDYDDVVRTLEVEGVHKFVASWNALLESVAVALGHRGADG